MIKPKLSRHALATQTLSFTRVMLEVIQVKHNIIVTEMGALRQP